MTELKTELNSKSKIIKIALISALSLFIAILSFMGLTRNATEKLNFVRNANTEYLSSAQERAVGGFLILSGIKTGLAVVEGSEVNISILGNGTSLQAGDTVQAVYDLIDWLWKTSFFGGAMLTALNTLLNMSSIVSLYSLGVSAFLFAIVYPASTFMRNKAIYRSVYSGLVISLAVFLICQFAIPLSIWSASKLSYALTLNAAVQAENEFRSFGDILAKRDSESMIEYSKRIISDFSQIVDSVKSKTKSLVVSGMKYMTAYLFDCLLFPLAMFEIIKRLVLMLLKYLFEGNGQTKPWLNWLLPSPLPVPIHYGGMMPPPHMRIPDSMPGSNPQERRQP